MEVADLILFEGKSLNVANYICMGRGEKWEKYEKMLHSLWSLSQKVSCEIALLKMIKRTVTNKESLLLHKSTILKTGLHLICLEK